MPSDMRQLEEVCTELQDLTIRRQQLSARLNLLSMLKEFRNSAGFREAAGSSRHNDEFEQIEEELGKLSERKKVLQARKDSLERSRVRFTDPGGGFKPSDVPAAPPFASQIFFVDQPPPFPAPQVILDLNKLPPRPSQTQCPYCQQYITTEVCAVVGNTTWMVCMMCTFICCIAGCCLIPFCIRSFKDIVHKCPKCRSRIHTCKKL